MASPRLVGGSRVLSVDGGRRCGLVAGDPPAPVTDVFPQPCAIRRKRSGAITGWAHAGDGCVFHPGEQLCALDPGVPGPADELVGWHSRRVITIPTAGR